MISEVLRSEALVVDLDVPGSMARVSIRPTADGQAPEDFVEVSKRANDTTVRQDKQKILNYVCSLCPLSGKGCPVDVSMSYDFVNPGPDLAPHSIASASRVCARENCPSIPE